MATQLLTRNIDVQTREEATEVTLEVQDRHIVGTVFELSDGSKVHLPDSLSELMTHVLHGVTQGGLRIQSIPDELTTTTASQMLGISRPTLMKMVKDGRIPSHRVGSHHRFRFTDVAAFRDKREEQRSEALDELLELELEHGIED